MEISRWCPTTCLGDKECDKPRLETNENRERAREREILSCCNSCNFLTLLTLPIPEGRWLLALFRWE